MAKLQRQILPVRDRHDKYITYQKQLTQLNKAIKEGFYFEAILIDYACLEDRLRYALYYLGVLKSEKDYKVTNPNSVSAKTFRAILREYEGPKANMDISSISGKRKVVGSVIHFVQDNHDRQFDDIIRQSLLNSLQDVSRIEEMLGLLNEIENWCSYRNEIIHSLMNKNTDSVYEKVEEQAIKGFDLFRRLDKLVGWIKRKQIREKQQI